MITLKNEHLEVVLSEKAAEIHKIIGLQDNMNYMWKRDASQWTSSAPILFPIVGALQNNECRVDGNTYTMTQHGFARHSVFTVVEASDSEVIFRLEPDEDISKQYPYLFQLDVIYTLEGNTLSCKCRVMNTDTKEIYFQIGGHPAFACPFFENESSNDYYVEFSDFETMEQKVIDVAGKGMSRVTKPFFENEKRFFVRQDLFANDAIVFENVKSKTVSIKSLNHQKAIHFHMDNFNHLGIWTAKHVGGLLAIEPWNGHSDYVDFTGEFKDKEGVVALPVAQDFTCAFKIEIQQ